MVKSISMGVVMLALVGCGGRSGIVQSGADTYTLVITGRSGFVASGDMKLKAYQQAAAYCHNRNGSILEVVTEHEDRGGVLGKFPGAELTFRCNPPK